MMTEEYKEIDKLLGMSIEPGDLLKLPNNEIVRIIRSEETLSGYDLFFLDLFEDEEICYSLDDAEFVTLLELD